MRTNLLIPIAWVAVVHLAAWGVGDTLRAALSGRGPRPAEHLYDAPLSGALGFVALAALALLLGALRMLHPLALIATTIAAAALGAWRLLCRRQPAMPRLSWRDLPLLLAAAVVVSFLPDALHPVLVHDDNVYHLLIPKTYLASHAIVAIPSNLYANMPHLVEVLYTVPMAIGDFTAAKVLNLTILFWIIAGLVAFARPRLGRTGAGVPALVFVSGSNVLWHLGLAHVEPVIGLFLLAALLAFLGWWESRNAGYLRLLATLVGAAMASKYSAWFFALPILLAVAIDILRAKAPPARKGWLLAQVAAIVLLLVSPWLIKNALQSGNPIYPNLYRVLGGTGWSEVQQMQYLRMQASVGGGSGSPADLLTLPLRLVTDRTSFKCSPFSISLMALLLATLVSPASYRAPQRSLTLAALFGFLAWALTVQQGRFLVAWVPSLALAVTPPIAFLRGRPRAALLAAGVVAALGVHQFEPRRFPPMWPKEVLTTPREELVRRNGNYGLCQYLNREVPPEGRVLALWDNRFFFLERPFDIDSVYEAPTGLARLRAHDDALAFARELLAGGYTHVVMNVFVAAGYLSDNVGFPLTDDLVYPMSRFTRDRVLLEQFVAGFLEEVQRQGNVVAYRIRKERVWG